MHVVVFLFSNAMYYYIKGKMPASLNEECSPNLNKLQGSTGASMSCSRSTLRVTMLPREYIVTAHIERCFGTL